MVLTDDSELASDLRILRNYGLQDRDTLVEFGVNSRLDTVQAAVGNAIFGELGGITSTRIQVAESLDQGLRDVDGITLPPRSENVQQVFHLYILFAERRDELLKHLIDQGVEAKIHYPEPLPLQPACARFGYRKGDFPVCEAQCDSMITLPCHQYVSDSDVDYMVSTIREFYA
jgi:dTDP-4-amino-4,6-dideoxygalactose transaminase